MNVPRVALIGLGGYGAVHLHHLRDFHRRGEIRFVAAVDFPPGLDPEATSRCQAEGCEIFPGFDELLAAVPRLKLDLVVVPTPIHLHARMTVALVRAGVDVLVEKPLASTLDDAYAISEARRSSGRMVAVGFQYLHAPEVHALKQRILSGAIGSLRRLTVQAAWPRSHAYYQRNTWAGRLHVANDTVLDSPVSNAMSHFFMVMLFLAGREAFSLTAPQQISAELYRAQNIESFDTGIVRMKTVDGVKLDFYGTHSSREINRPSLSIEGTGGSAEWVQDSHARAVGPADEWTYSAAPEPDTRERMLRDVLAHRREGRTFICTPEMATAHVACIAELHRDARIKTIPSDQLASQYAQGTEFTYVPQLDQQLARAAREGLSLAEVGATWAVPPQAMREYRA